MAARARVRELRCHPDSVAAAPDTALQHVADSQVLPHLLHVGGTLDDVFALQDDITAKVLSAVGPEITLAEMRRARGKRSESFDAWDRYLLALQPFYAMDKAGYEGATALLQQAIDLDQRNSRTRARASTYGRTVMTAR